MSHSFLYLKLVKTQFHVIFPAIRFALKNTRVSGKSYLFGEPIIFSTSLDIPGDIKNPCYVLMLYVRRKKLLSHEIILEIDRCPFRFNFTCMGTTIFTYINFPKTILSHCQPSITLNICHWKATYQTENLFGLHQIHKCHNLN